MKTKHNMKRGHYNTKRKIASPGSVDELAKLPYLEFVAHFYNGMTVLNDHARLTLAETAASLTMWR